MPVLQNFKSIMSVLRLPNRNVLSGFLLFSLCILFANNTGAQQSNNTGAQQLRIREFALFGGDGACPSPLQTAPAAPGCGVQMGTSTTVTSGKVGSYKLVR